MPSTLPDGDPVPDDGALPDSALATLCEGRFGVYVHVPFCATRCGYCDFNTYTASELGPGASRDSYADTVVGELDLAAGVLGASGGAPLPASTVFFGGGTPTLLPDGALPDVLRRIDATFGIAPDAEVTTEANPDSVDARSLAALRAGGINRISFGVQSAVPHVLAALDRTHDASRVPEVVAAARAAGFEQVSVDLIYGTPGESMADWQASLDFAVGLEPDHVSAYALIVEQGTALARSVARGEVAAPDDDEMADKYIAADETLEAGGFGWYELSNWARTPAARCRHNELYWTGGDWWGAGPGAHSHVGGVRWWNVKHPAAYAQRLDAGQTPAQARELLEPETRRVERVLLESRLRDGLPLDVLDRAGRSAVPDLVTDGLAELMAPAESSGGAATVGQPGGAATAERLVLTRRGRLLADAVVHRLLP